MKLSLSVGHAVCSDYLRSKRYGQRQYVLNPGQAHVVPEVGLLPLDDRPHGNILHSACPTAGTFLPGDLRSAWTTISLHVYRVHSVQQYIKLE